MKGRWEGRTRGPQLATLAFPAAKKGWVVFGGRPSEEGTSGPSNQWHAAREGKELGPQSLASHATRAREATGDDRWSVKSRAEEVVDGVRVKIAVVMMTEHRRGSLSNIHYRVAPHLGQCCTTTIINRRVASDRYRDVNRASGWGSTKATTDDQTMTFTFVTPDSLSFTSKVQFVPNGLYTPRVLSTRQSPFSNLRALACRSTHSRGRGGVLPVGCAEQGNFSTMNCHHDPIKKTPTNNDIFLAHWLEKAIDIEHHPYKISAILLRSVCDRPVLRHRENAPGPRTCPENDLPSSVSSYPCLYDLRHMMLGGSLQL